jgi:hypothetical protein
VALGLIGLGVMALMGIGLLWPMFILLPGLVMLGAALYSGKAAAGLAIPGMIVTGTGGLLFIQNLTGYWESWSYAWTLYGVFLGMGFVIMARLMEQPALERVGRGFIWAGVVSFGVFAFLMMAIFDVGGGPGSGLWAAMLIGAGLFILVLNIAGRRGELDKPKRKSKREDRLFTGPVVYGSRTSSPDFSHLSSADREPDEPPAREP